jgi:vitamin K-dependent gamma-carboxylase
MNGRFNQRQIDPRIDLLSSEAKWSVFEDTSWLLPLLTNLSDWRTRMLQIENDLSSKDQNVLVTFVADFPGLFLENYIPPDLNTTIEVLEGQILVEMLGLKQNVTLNVGQNITVPSGDYHNVHTISSSPSCYMYVYLNQSDVEIVQLWDRYFNLTDRLLNETINRTRPLHNDKEEADLVRLSYENVFEELRNKTIHELLEIPYDFKLHNKNETNTNWTTIRLQFETSMNRSIVRRLDTQIKQHEKYLRTFKTFINKKRRQFIRWYDIKKFFNLIRSH